MTTTPVSRPPTRVLAGLTLILVLEGLASVRIGYASFEFRQAVLVLATGWLLAACGLAAWVRDPSSRIGPLLLLVAGTWYLAGFRWVAYPPAADVFTGLSLLYAAVTAHALLTFPGGRAGPSPIRIAILACYLAALLPVPRADVLVAALLLAGIGLTAVGDPGRRRELRPALASGTFFAIVLAGHHLVPASIKDAAWIDARPLLMLALVGVAAALSLPLVRPRTSPGRVADVVVELGTDPRADLVAELGVLVGDPDVRVGFLLPGERGYVDARGDPIELPRPGGDRIATVIDRGGGTIGVVVHAASVEIEPRVRQALGRAIALMAANARLQVDLQAQARVVRASRLRLLVAGDEERVALERRLDDLLTPRVDALEASLAAPSLVADEAARSALDHLREMRRDLVALIDGIAPPLLDERGMGGALADLARHATLPVEVRVEGQRPPSRAVQMALLFVAREAVANIAKHSGASLARIHLDGRDGEAWIAISDDGHGGADAGRGTGLQGLRDRIEALGGRLTIDSDPGRGTRVEARLPLRESAA